MYPTGKGWGRWRTCNQYVKKYLNIIYQTPTYFSQQKIRDGPDKLSAVKAVKFGIFFDLRGRTVHKKVDTGRRRMQLAKNCRNSFYLTCTRMRNLFFK